MKGVYNIADMRALARRRLPRGLFEYVDRGAEDEVAIAENRHALERIKFRPRVLRNVGVRQIERKLFGKPIKAPFAVAPTAVAGMLWYDGDVASARAAAAAGIPYTLSTASVTPLEKVAAGAPDARLWFQLYVFGNRDHMRELVGRAKNAGYEALLLTVDTAVAAKREYNARNGFNIPISYNPRTVLDIALHPRWLLGVVVKYRMTTGIPRMAHYPKRHALTTRTWTNANMLDASIDWGTVDELRELWPGKLLIKGVQHPEDAKLCVQHGADGIVVSNHGGRNLDAAMATIDSLPGVVAAAAGRVPVLIDSAFYRGSDIVKALALGASAVLTGRSILWGTASAGEAGARQSIAILAEEIDRVIGQLGCASIDQLGPDILWRHGDG